MGLMHAFQGEGPSGMLKMPHVHEHCNTNVSQAKPTHQNIIRLAPPLVITEDEISKALDIIKQAVTELPKSQNGVNGTNGTAADKVNPPPEKKIKVDHAN